MKYNADQILIVYGSLAPGRTNHHLLEDIQGEWKKGFIYGKLEDRGWGAGLGYPGFVMSDDAEQIEVDVLFANSLEEHLSKLDEFEGEEYQREQIDFELPDGSLGRGWIYLLKEGN